MSCREDIKARLGGSCGMHSVVGVRPGTESGANVTELFGNSITGVYL